MRRLRFRGYYERPLLTVVDKTFPNPRSYQFSTAYCTLWQPNCFFFFCCGILGNNLISCFIGLEINLSFALFCRFYSNEFKVVKSFYEPSIRRTLIPVFIARSNLEYFYSPVGSSGLPPALKYSIWIPMY